MRVLFFLIALSLLASCENLVSTDTYTYTVRNESGVNVKIIGYVTFTNVEEFIINIENGKEHTQVYEDGLPPRGYHFRYSFGVLDFDA